MLQQIKILTRLELTNLFGRNARRFTKDPKAKRKARLMAGVYGFLILAAFMYMGGLSWGLVQLGAGAAVMPYLITLASLLIFFFGVFTAGGTLFRRNGFEILCALPLSQGAVVTSRFFRMYVEDLALTLVVLIPGLSVYGWLERPGIGFWLAAPVGVLAVPLLPAAASALVGAVVTAVSSRMKHKGIAEAALSILLVLGVFALMPGAAALEGTVTPEMLAEMSDKVLELLGMIYPPALWLGTAVTQGNPGKTLGWALVCAGGFLSVAALVSARYIAICGRLFGSVARHDYRMEQLRQSSLLACLCRREFKRYFASGIYVSNTIMGPVLGVVMSAALVVTGVDGISQMLMLPLDIGGLVPFLAAGVFSMMPPVSVSVSMEGKNWWIVKSLPIPTKTILDAKLLMNLLLILPFYLVSEILLILALRPGVAELVWLVVIPLVLVLFSCVFALTANLRLPVMEWESEASVVKQSSASLVGGMGGLLATVLCAAVTLLTGGTHAGKLAVCLVLLGLTVVLYRMNVRTDLKNI